MLASIQKLVSMGFNEEDAGFALRVAAFNEEKAARKLIKGLKRDRNHPAETLRDKILANPQNAVELLQQATVFDVPIQVIMEHLGLNPDAFDLSSARETTQQQTSAAADGDNIDLPDFLEKVQQLVDMGFNEAEVVGTLLVTDLNLEISLNKLCEGEGPELAEHPLAGVRRRLRSDPSSCVEICRHFIASCTFQGPRAQQTRRNVMNRPDVFMREIGLNPLCFDTDAIRRSFENEPVREEDPLGPGNVADIHGKVQRLHQRFNNGELPIELVFEVLVQSGMDEERAAQPLGELRP